VKIWISHLVEKVGRDFAGSLKEQSGCTATPIPVPPQIMAEVLSARRLHIHR
jgi:hypothetical protein